MKLPNREDLKAITKGSLQKKNAAETARAEAAKALALAKQAEERGKADRVLAVVDRLCRDAAEHGFSSARVYRLTRGDVVQGKYSNLEEEDLRGAAALIFQELWKAGLSPYIEYNHDGVGVESWNDIHVTWFS